MIVSVRSEDAYDAALDRKMQDCIPYRESRRSYENCNAMPSNLYLRDFLLLASLALVLVFPTVYPLPLPSATTLTCTP